MQLNSRLAAFAAAWILAIAVGFVAGRRSAPQPESGQVEAPVGSRTGPRSPAGTTAMPAAPGETGKTRGDRVAGGGARPGSSSGAAASARIRTLLANPDRLARTRALLELADRLAPDEFQGVVEALRNDPLAAARRTEYYLMVNAWVAADPHAAAGYLLDSDADGYVRESALAAWAARDPYAAAEWAKGKKDGGSVNNWTIGVIRGVASNDPHAALALLQELPGDRTRSEAIRDMLPYVAQNGFGFTTDWLSSIDDEGLLRETSRRAARTLTKMDAARAGDWIRSMENVKARRDASEEVSDQWARTDLEAARRWAEGLPQDTRTEAAEGVVRQMARRDPERAAQWLAGLENSPDLDGARYSFLEVTHEKHPQVALETATALHKESDRVKWMSRILGSWQKRDQQTTRTWVEVNAAALPERIVKHYLKKS
ncbi:MAG: hypothetical protein HKN82_09620 [Akkermansiaceae bacterium]|nr:hypothetical protein [Akkermansiaceae bacterium]NNM29484.1 hypothetical protein [Akkermansiaceae bacterium]